MPKKDNLFGRRLSVFLPIAGWLPAYKRSWLSADAVAGIVLAGLLVPEGMAYAGIVGVPPQAGLYAAMIGLLIYAIFGSSHHLAVSATSSTAVMLYATIASLGIDDPGRQAALVAAAVIMTGLIFLAAGFIRLGFVSDFMARPVITGFVFGLALLIAVRQLPKLFGLPAVSGKFFPMVWDVVNTLGQTSLATLALGAGALAVLFAFDFLFPKVPGAIVVLALGILAVTLLGLDSQGVAIVGSVPGGLPALTLPDFTFNDVATLLPGAAGIALVAYAESLTTARAFASKHRYNINPNRELKAVGAANVGSGLLGGIVVGGGLSGSATNESAGAKTEISAIITSFAILATLLLLTPVFDNLPEAVLGAIVIHAVRQMMDFATMRRYASLSYEGPIVSLAALFGVLFLDIIPGLALAVTLSLLLLIREASRPSVAVLGRRPGTSDWVNRADHSPVEQVPGVIVCRIDGVLFFANADFVRRRILAAVRRSPRPLPRVVIDMEMIPDIDITATMAFHQLIRELRVEGAEVSLAELHTPVRRMLSRDGIIEDLGQHKIFPTIEEAVAAATALGALAQTEGGKQTT